MNAIIDDWVEGACSSQTSAFLIKSVKAAASVQEIAEIVDVAKAFSGRIPRRDLYPGIYVHAVVRAYEIDATCEATQDLEMAWSEAAEWAGWHLTKRALKLKLLSLEAEQTMGGLEQAIRYALSEP